MITKAKQRQIEKLLPSDDILNQFLELNIQDPHSLLGMHYDKKLKSIIIRCYDPTADKIIVISDSFQIEMDKIHESGLFAVQIKGVKKHFDYQLEKYFADVAFLSHDPYSFLPELGEMDTYLFNEGEHHEIYKVMGAHNKKVGGVEGTGFAVWSPNAQRVSVVGDFNNWDGRRHLMRQMGNTGIWELFIPELKSGEIYKFEISDKKGNVFCKLDPYAFQAELRPKNAGVIASSDEFKWSDSDWINNREKVNSLSAPINIYEVHLASWRGAGLREIDLNNDSDFHNYRELAHALADYINDMGYTHIELLPVAEHPLDQSWGYQVSAYYAPTSRYGTPEDFAYFVDHMHKMGIGVILDWVPAHFPKDAFSLGRFDGTALYEHEDPRQGEHRDWGTYIFNYGRNEVKNFLMGNAFYWFDKFHIDGLRVDAVASMLYLDYSKEDGDWIPNKYGGNENLDAIDFMKRLNELTNSKFPGTLMIAEESTSWPNVSRPLYLGGLGYNYKWNMGWMHDTLEYFQHEPIHRSYHQGTLTFSLLYAYTENFMLPLSHDEVVHEKRSMLDKMPGDYWQKFANLRALYGYMISHPGKKLLFMGGEIGQWTEWDSQKGLDWNILEYDSHRNLKNYVKDLNELYRHTNALWEEDFNEKGFEWLDASNYEQSVLAYIRWDRKHENPVVIVINLTPNVRGNYHIGVPLPGKWLEIFNSDDEQYGGSGVKNSNIEPSVSESQIFHGQHNSVTITLPPLGVVYLQLGSK